MVTGGPWHPSPCTKRSLSCGKDQEHTFISIHKWLYIFRIQNIHKFTFLLNKASRHGQIGDIQNTKYMSQRDAKQSLQLWMVQMRVACRRLLKRTAGEQLMAHTRCSDFVKPCLYHSLIHPPWLRFVQSDCLNCLRHFMNTCLHNGSFTWFHYISYGNILFAGHETQYGKNN